MPVLFFWKNQTLNQTLNQDASSIYVWNQNHSNLFKKNQNQKVLHKSKEPINLVILLQIIFLNYCQ